MSVHDDRVFVIAEAGVNHNGSLARAIKLVEVAKNSGADAVKFQTFVPEMVVTFTAEQAEYQTRNIGTKMSQLEMIRSLALSKEDHLQLKNICDELNIEFMTTPFDVESLEFITRDLQVQRIKMASGEITHANLLFQAAKTKLPIILSTGMSTSSDIRAALRVLLAGYANEDPRHIDFTEPYQFNSQQVALLKQNIQLLHCVTEYPAPVESMNLRVIPKLKDEFGLPVGLSDHTSGWAVSVAAVALGASVVEKHFTLDKSLEGPDHKASLDPIELKEMIDMIREASSALGDGVKRPAECELKNSKVARRSLIAADNIQADEVFTEKNLTAKRPSSGTSPMCYWKYLGMKASKDYQKDGLIDE